ncbi:MAG: FAD-binding protein [Chloroflexota bacterium]|nr:MAG: FAD-binding protein [Chloroflexota bacterium]
MTTIRNWDGSQIWRPEQIHRPADEEAVIALIKQAAEEGKRLKPVGNALSWSDIADVPALAIQFDNMSSILDVDRDGKSIKLQAGAPLMRVNESLADHGLALDNFGSIVKQTAAGYIATASHGTGIRTRILSTYVESLRLIDGLGQVHELDAGTEPELFAAARVNLGCLGVVTELTLGCVEAFDLEERLELVDFDKALADLDSTLRDNDYCKFWWMPCTDQIQVYAFKKTDRPRGGAGFNGFLDRSGISGVAFSGLIAAGRFFPGAIPSINRTVQNVAFGPHSRVDRSDRIVTVPSGIPKHQETEYAIPVEYAAEAIDRLRKIVLGADYRVNFIVEVRFVAADDIPMSPTNGRDSCYIGPYVANEKWAAPYFADFEEMIGDYAGRPHWGKSFSLAGKAIRALYPAYDDFNHLRQPCDPHGLFRNSFVDRVFPG